MRSARVYSRFVKLLNASKSFLEIEELSPPKVLVTENDDLAKTGKLKNSKRQNISID